LKIVAALSEWSPYFTDRLDCGKGRTLTYSKMHGCH
jgi:hypothetical protein